MNKTMLIGRLMKDPEVRYSAGESLMAVARYTLAVDSRTKDGVKPDFIPCKALGKKAGFAKCLAKGTKVAVTGRLQTDDSMSKEGQRASVLEVIVEECELA